jgi:hypothetical protein
MIVKVQTAMFSTTGKERGRGLVYDENREHQIEQPIPMEVYNQVAKLPRPKAFFHATWAGSFWEIGPPAEWQSW